jgi:hypothetical protein
VLQDPGSHTPAPVGSIRFLRALYPGTALGSSLRLLGASRASSIGAAWDPRRHCGALAAGAALEQGRGVPLPVHTQLQSGEGSPSRLDPAA